MDILVIDDVRKFKHLRDQDELKVRYCLSSSSGILVLTDRLADTIWRFKPTLKELWLDHDLGGDDTIMPVIEYLCMIDPDLKSFVAEKIFIHSANPAGADRMYDYLNRYGYKSIQKVPAPECCYE